jgi:hypothetical protein
MPETTIPEKIAQAVQAALLAGPQMTGIADRVFRAREDAINRDEGDTLNLKSDSEQLQPIGDDVDDAEFILSVQIYVSGDVWETKADAYALLAHRRILGCDYAAAGVKLARVRRTDGDWGGDEGDATPGRRTLKYGFRYTAFAADMTKQP